MSQDRTVAIILAAGQGKRMKSNIQKQYLLIHEKPVLYYALKVVEESFIDEMILVVAPGEKEYCEKEIVERFQFSKIKMIVEGGAERYHSVFNGINAIENCDYVFIHDGARPFITKEILQRAYDSVKINRACVVGVPVKDTIRIADANGYADTTPDRDLVWSVQTPQVFDYNLIKGAYQELIENEDKLREQNIKITDDAMVVETFTNEKIKLVQGDYTNLKITTPDDLEVAKSIKI